jgi:hypothetical protein
VLNLKLLVGTFFDIKEGNIEVIIAGLNEAKAKTGKGKPVCILLHTEMVTALIFMMHTHVLARKSTK